MNALHTQGKFFIVVAIASILCSFLLPPVGLETELLVMLVLVFFLGVPHGALDPIFAKAILQLRTPLAWLGFVLAYLFIAGGVVLVWKYSPLVFLILFLFISVVHFSGDLVDGTAHIARILYGGACIVLPAAFHAEELGSLFSLLIGESSGTLVAQSLGWVAWPWLVALVLSALLNFKNNKLASAEMMMVAALTTVLSPLIGFTIFFCCMHSARHVVRAKNYSGALPRDLAKVVALPMLGVLVLVVVGWIFLPASKLDTRIIQIVFVGLAALTVPHMALVERVRWTGWKTIASSSR